MTNAKAGRPPKGAETMMSPITIRLPPAMVAKIDALRTQREDAPDKATVIRELLALALKKGGRK